MAKFESFTTTDLAGALQSLMELSLLTIYFNRGYFFNCTDKVPLVPRAFWPVNSLQQKPESRLRVAQGETEYFELGRVQHLLLGPGGTKEKDLREHC